MDLSLLTFALLALVVVLTPGPTVLLALTNGTRFGFGAAGYGIAGAALSDAVLIAAAGLGLGALLAASALLFSLVKAIGVAYLLWLGIQMLRSSGDFAPLSKGGPGHSTGWALFGKSLAVAVTNPKGYLFFTAFLPQFLIPSQPMLPQYITLGLIFIVIDVGVMAAYAGLGARAVRFLSTQGALWLDRVCGGLLLVLAAGLAVLKRGTG